MMLKGRSFLFAALGCGLVMFPVAGVLAQEPAAPPAAGQSQAQPSSGQDQEPDPLKRERSDKEKFAAQKAVRQELKGAYKTWLTQDVAYIITDEETKAFKTLSNDEERDAFIEQFWLRRNPDPDSPENEFREEHYRRIAYANEHFAAGKPGWRTDRGQIYIEYGKPDSIDAHPSGGEYNRPADEGGGATVTFPFEVWTYHYIEGIGNNVEIEFVDTCQCGDYHFTIDKGEKDALQHVPVGGATMAEQFGGAHRQDRQGQALIHWETAGRASRSRARSLTASRWPPSCLLRRRSNSQIWTPSSQSTNCWMVRYSPLTCAPTL